MSRSAAQKMRVAVMDLTPDNFFAPTSVTQRARINLTRNFAHITFVCITAFARGHAGLHRLRRIEEGALKFKRFDDFARSNMVERLSAESLD